jgi:UDP-N-acetylmuramate--alanine ligase
LSAFGSNARLGRGEYLVAEADESDRSFLVLYPTIAVMTNIDREHMESYGSFEELQQAFVDFANKVPFYGTVVACSDDAAVASVLPRINRPLVTYGLEGRERRDRGQEGQEGQEGRERQEGWEGERRKGVHVDATDVEIGAFGGRCIVHVSDRERRDRLGELRLAIPGRHNLQNALAAVAVADRLGIPFGKVAAALADFHGAERRFERHGEADGVLVIDDYGHHPTEIAAVLAAARATLGRRLIVAFQPHRYTRTQQLMEAFGPALREADEIILTDIYGASEEPIAGVTVDALAAAVRGGSGRRVHVAKRLDEVIPAVLEITRPGDVVITLGAGSIGTLPVQLVDALKQREGTR